MYTVTSFPLLNRTRVIFRKAEFGFLGVMVRTNKQTPCFCGHFSSTGLLVVFFCTIRLLRTNWLIVGMGNRVIRWELKKQYQRWDLNPHVLADTGF